MEKEDLWELIEDPISPSTTLASTVSLAEGQASGAIGSIVGDFG